MQTIFAIKEQTYSSDNDDADKDKRDGLRDREKNRGIGAAVLELRQERHWRQIDLTQKLVDIAGMQISRSFVSSLETGAVKDVSADIFVALAAAFGITLEILAQKAGYLSYRSQQQVDTNVLVLPSSISDPEREMLQRMIACLATTSTFPASATTISIPAGTTKSKRSEAGSGSGSTTEEVNQHSDQVQEGTMPGNGKNRTSGSDDNDNNKLNQKTTKSGEVQSTEDFDEDMRNFSSSARQRAYNQQMQQTEKGKVKP